MSGVVESRFHSYFRLFALIAKKGTLASSFPCVRPSVRIYQSGSLWTYFSEIWYWGLFMKLCRDSASFVKIGPKSELCLKTNTSSHRESIKT